MNRLIPPVAGPIRLVFTLDREEDPELFDDLMRFRKGCKRVNRLRMLARDGCRLQRGTLSPGDAARTMPPPLAAAAQDGWQHAPTTSQVFDDPALET